jgi:hypothetical protein
MLGMLGHIGIDTESRPNLSFNKSILQVGVFALNRYRWRAASLPFMSFKKKLNTLPGRGTPKLLFDM